MDPRCGKQNSIMSVIACAHSWFLVLIAMLTPTGQTIATIAAAKETAPTSATGAKEYCLTEHFEAACNPGQVIVMEAARFGRMGLGRCVKRNYGHVGCATNVLGLTDSHCSGRRSCRFAVADPKLGILGTSPCPQDFSSYLEAKYRCVNAPSCERTQCESSSFLHLTAPVGYLASSVTAKKGCGSASCPWVIEALPGQRINITLFDFSIAARNNSHGGNHRPGYPIYCHEYAIIKETEVPRSTTICGGDYRERVAYVSSSNKVEITMIARKTGSNAETFMIKYNAFGCPAITPPRDAWVQRVEDKAIIKCNHSRESWSMVCRGTEWVGEMRNCSESGKIEEQPWSIEGVVAGMGLPSIGVSVLIIFGVAMVVVIYIAVSIVCVFYFRRRRRRDAARRSLAERAMDEGSDPAGRPNTDGYEERIPMLVKNGKAIRRADGEYADICEMQVLGHTGSCLAEVKDLTGTFKGQCHGARTVVSAPSIHPSGEKCMTISQGGTLRTFKVPKDPSHVYECPAVHQARQATATIQRGTPIRGQHYHELDPSMLHNYNISAPEGVLISGSADPRQIRFLPDLMPEAAIENSTNTLRSATR